MAAKRSDAPAEFFTPVDLYLSPKASVSLRKVCSSLSPSFPSSPIRLPFCQTFHNRTHRLLEHTSLLPSRPRSSIFTRAYSLPARGAWTSVSKVIALRPFRALPMTEKIADKNSWLSLSKGSAGAAQWRAATCRLSEEEGGCQLNVYVEVRRSGGPVKPSRSKFSSSVSYQETFLHQAVYIYLLKATDIRPADRSLFDRKDILVIHTVPFVFIIASQQSP